MPYGRGFATATTSATCLPQLEQRIREKMRALAAPARRQVPRQGNIEVGKTGHGSSQSLPAACVGDTCWEWLPCRVAVPRWTSPPQAKGPREIPLADLHALPAKNVVGRGGVKVEIRL